MSLYDALALGISLKERAWTLTEEGAMRVTFLSRQDAGAVAFKPILL